MRRTYHGIIALPGEFRNRVIVVETDDSDNPRTRRERDLPLHFKVRNHSPTGFNWGYGGSGPAQLALALCIDAIAERPGRPRKSEIERAERVYQNFKFRVVARWPQEEAWVVSRALVLHEIEELEREGAVGRPAAGTPGGGE